MNNGDRVIISGLSTDSAAGLNNSFNVAISTARTLLYQEIPNSVTTGVVTDIYESRGRQEVVVDFDDIDVLTEYSENEFLFADSIYKIGVYVDHEGLVY